MNASTVPSLLRRLTLSIAIATFAAHATFGGGYLIVEPGAPEPTDSVGVTVFPSPLGPDPCVLWQVADRRGERIELRGVPATSSHCPTPAQGFDLGNLPAGRYQIEARIDGSASPFAAANLVVRPHALDPINFYDVALADPSPRAGDPNGLTLSIVESVCGGSDFTAPPTVVGDHIVLDGHLGECPFEPVGGLKVSGFHHDLPPLSAGIKTIEIREAGHTFTTFAYRVDEDATLLPGADGRFAASVRWTDRAGLVHDATAVRFSETSGQFWFFDPSNPEVTVKLVDGTAYNDRWWVFVSSMTDLGFTVTVHSSLCAGPGTCVHDRVYSQAAGHNRNFIDTSAFQP